MSPHLPLILFLFALGACVGSFLNVVVWRLPRGQSLVSPPSHCPKCSHRLAWYDNIPVLGWIFLRGRCRYCHEPISARYPIIEFITGALFVFYYVMFFIYHIGPCAPRQMMVANSLLGPSYVNVMPGTLVEHWPIYLLCMAMMAALLAISLIDAELFIIPSGITWFLAGLGALIHALVDRPTLPGALNLEPTGIGGPMAVGGAVGLLLSLALYYAGVLKQSFPEGDPELEVDEELYRQELAAAKKEGREPAPRPRTYTKAEIRSEIRKEMTFLMPPLLLALLSGALALYLPSVASFWTGLLQYHWLSGLLGSVLGALVGGLVVWLARILGTMAFGRVAMGLGDVDLMFAVGAVIGAGPATLAFFLAPFAGAAVGVYNLLLRQRRELPYGPYLSLATGLVVLVYCPIADYLRPGMQGLSLLLRGWLLPG